MEAVNAVRLFASSGFVDANIVLTGSSDGNVRVWDLCEGNGEPTCVEVCLPSFSSLPPPLCLPLPLALLTHALNQLTASSREQVVRGSVQAQDQYQAKDLYINLLILFTLT